MMRVARIWLERRRRFVLFALAFCAALMVIGALNLALLSSIGGRHGKQPGGNSSLVTGGGDPNSAISLENRQPGTTSWELDPGSNPYLLQGYASVVSALPGETVTIFVSGITVMNYNIGVYRMGYYQGLGGRLLRAIPDQTAQPLGYWTPNDGLLHCATCLFDPTTRRLDANWAPATTIVIGTDWLSGMYLIKLATLDRRAESYIPLVVRSATPTPAPILVSFPVNTYQAYNQWGGYSLYGEYNNAQHLYNYYYARATKVSFNRPYSQNAGAGDFLSWDYYTVRWLERAGFAVDYTTSVDVATTPSVLTQHRVYLSVGHDEYWTKSMYDGIQAARDAGVSLAFFGANDAYWQARLEPDNAGHQDRTLVCYKVDSSRKSDPTAYPVALDPMYKIDPSQTTAQWRDPTLNRPENALLGLMYSSIVDYENGGRGYTKPDWVVNNPPLDPLMYGTGLTPGMHIKGGLLGYEFDSYFANGRAPANLVILAKSPLATYHKITEYGYTSYYFAPSGALVFDAGSIWWGWGLDTFVVPYATQQNQLRGSQPIVNFSTNLLHAMLSSSPVAPGLATGGTATPTDATATPGPVPTLPPTPTPRPTPTVTPTPKVSPTPSPTPHH